MIQNNKKYWLFSLPLFILLFLLLINILNKKVNPDDYKLIFTAATSSNVKYANSIINEDNIMTTINVNLESPNDNVMIDFTIKNTGYYKVIINNLIIDNKNENLKIDIVNFNNRLGTPVLIGETIPGSIYITSNSKSKTNFNVTIDYTPLKKKSFFER